MLWIQNADLEELQLDIVGFLAILGEGSVLANVQVLTLSRWIFLPRLIPAPQALMRPTRPTVLEPVPGHVTGVFSGNFRDSITHIGNIICDASNLPEFSVRVVSIRRTGPNRLKSKTVAPLTLVLFIGFSLSILLLVLSIVLDDGMSLVATLLLSFLSTLIGWGNKWTLVLPERKEKRGKVPRGDVVIRYPKGSFLVVRCEEEVARELYWAPETVKYLMTHGPAYRVMSLVGTVMLMGGVICLANAQIKSQIAWAGSYMLLGSSYWIVAALPSKLHWDTSSYTVENECLTDSDMELKGYPCANKTFTQALWHAIVVAKSTDWVIRSNACPDTRTWKDWLAMATEMSKAVKEAPTPRSKGVKTWQVPDWDPQAYLAELFDQGSRNDEKRDQGFGIQEV